MSYILSCADVYLNPPIYITTNAHIPAQDFPLPTFLSCPVLPSLSLPQGCHSGASQLHLQGRAAQKVPICRCLLQLTWPI